ncbi:MAG: tRNA-intron lyase [Nitrososphaerales archaeon]
MSAAIPAELVGNRIIIWSIEDARSLFKEGFYGKPLGIPKPKNAEFNAPLVLDLIEGYYLLERGRITISRSPLHSKVGIKMLKKICESEYIEFPEKYLVYRNLRDAGLVVSPGIKFGCDFAVYEHGPGIDHAPYLVEVVKPSQDLTATRIILSGRLATTVRKQFILAVADVVQKRVEFITFDWWRA